MRQFFKYLLKYLTRLGAVCEFAVSLSLALVLDDRLTDQ